MTAEKPEPGTSQSTRGRRRFRVARGEGSDIPSDPEELAEDIERTRKQIGDTVEALTAKLDPKTQFQQAAERAKGRAAEAAGQARKRLTGTTENVTQQVRTTSARVVHTADEQRMAFMAGAATFVVVGGAWMTWVMRRR